ncbi:hypothetical protein [Streptacidiphilus monticola]|jgi:predicted lipoprotein with Yx(FWY)xxD motif|uniref:Lipoprotein n=1 Tax=Streptacidiphilus monticola TaxID=2161674 RepID=A0ABW1FWV9_9ACTN
MRRAVLSLPAVLLLAGCAAARAAVPADTPPTPPPPTVLVADTDTQGRVLTDDHGDVLYHFDGDQGGSIGCVDACTATRHPLLHDPAVPLQLPVGIAGTLGLVTRPEGGEQVSYDGEPLYTFTGDQPGDTNGVTLSWHVVNPPNRVNG